jgi:hypothetical protein
MSSNERSIVATGDVLYSGQHTLASGGSGSGSWWARFTDVDTSSTVRVALGHSRDYEGASQAIPVQWGQTYQIEVLEGAADSVSGALYQQTLGVGDAFFTVEAGGSAAASTALGVPSYDPGSYGPDQPSSVTVPTLILPGQVLPVPSQVTVVVLPVA